VDLSLAAVHAAIARLGLKKATIRRAERGDYRRRLRVATTGSRRRADDPRARLIRNLQETKSCRVIRAGRQPARELAVARFSPVSAST
jgi:hypothetical protein